MKTIILILCSVYPIFCLGQISRFDQPAQNMPKYQPFTYDELSRILNRAEQKQANNEQKVLKLIDDVCYLHALTNDTLFQKRMVSLYNILKYWYEEVPLAKMDNEIKKVELSIKEAITEHNKRINKK